jgi:hypothetical protein
VSDTPFVDPVSQQSDQQMERILAGQPAAHEDHQHYAEDLLYDIAPASSSSDPWASPDIDSFISRHSSVNVTTNQSMGNNYAVRSPFIADLMGGCRDPRANFTFKSANHIYGCPYTSPKTCLVRPHQLRARKPR